MKKTTSFILILFVIVLTACSQTLTKYQCSDGSFKESSNLCPISKSPSEEIKTNEIIKFVCEDGTTVKSIEDCSAQEINPVQEITSNGEINNYEYTIVNKFMVVSSDFWNNDIKVTLIKVGVEKFGEKMRIRPYLKIENPGTKTISLHPHQHTIILDTLGGQYESTLISYGDELDDFKIGSNSGGELRPGVIAEGGISIDNVPSDVNKIKIIFDLTGYEGIEFNVNLEA